jgi:hypothetical protein
VAKKAKLTADINKDGNAILKWFDALGIPGQIFSIWRQF